MVGYFHAGVMITHTTDGHRSRRLLTRNHAHVQLRGH